jgi:hypothetical protein
LAFLDLGVGVREKDYDRRRFLKAAATVTWATPLVMTLPAQRAAAQGVSCIPAAASCANYVVISGVGPACIPPQGQLATCCTGACLPDEDALVCRCTEVDP